DIGLDPWFLRIVGGRKEFLARDFGYCALHEGRVVSMCASCGTGGGEVELEVGTAAEFRGQGLATMACRAFIEHCQRVGVRPGYTCAAGNAPSASVAHKLGFIPTEDIPCYPLQKPSSP